MEIDESDSEYCEESSYEEKKRHRDSYDEYSMKNKKRKVHDEEELK